MTTQDGGPAHRYEVLWSANTLTREELADLVDAILMHLNLRALYRRMPDMDGRAEFIVEDVR